MMRSFNRRIERKCIVFEWKYTQKVVLKNSKNEVKRKTFEVLEEGRWQMTVG